MRCGVLMYRTFARFWHNVVRERQRQLFADVHAALYQRGYTFQVSFYGTTIVPYDGFHYQARIETMSDHELTGQELATIYRYLGTHQPDDEYTLYTITGSTIVRLSLR
jgi:hypothetical protein